MKTFIRALPLAAALGLSSPVCAAGPVRILPNYGPDPAGFPPIGNVWEGVLQDVFIPDPTTIYKSAELETLLNEPAQQPINPRPRAQAAPAPQTASWDVAAPSDR